MAGGRRRRSLNHRARKRRAARAALVVEQLEDRRLLVGGAASHFLDSGQLLGDVPFDPHFGSVGVALGDIDNDGDLDALFANVLRDLEPGGELIGGTGNRVYVNHNGVFVDSGQELGDRPSAQVLLGDLDGDSDLDAFVTNFGPNTVWLNDGNGTFSDSGSLLGSGLSFDGALGDLDGDGDLDVVVSNASDEQSGSGAGEVWINQGINSGTFVDQAVGLWGDGDSTGIDLADVDGDGDLDVFVAQHFNAAGDGPGSEKVFLNQGDGTFVDSGQSLGSQFSIGVVLEDFDGDGDPDAFVTGAREFPQGSGPDGVRTPNHYYVNQGGAQGGTAGVFGAAIELSNPNQDQARVAAADFDGDGDLDVFVANVKDTPNSGDGQNRIYVNQGGLQGGTLGEFANHPQALGNSHSVAAGMGDVNGDGRVDVVVANQASPNRVWLNLPHPVISYEAIGNVPIDVPAASGLLAGTSGLQIVGHNAGSTAGQLNVQADGSFTYTPPTGFLGIDTFTVERSDGEMRSVVINVGNAIWFVDQNAPAGGDGSAGAPLQTLAALNSGGTAEDKPGDLIFINGDGTYDVGAPAGFELEFAQTVLTSWSDPFGDPQFMTDIHFPLAPFSDVHLPRGFTGRPMLLNSAADAPVLQAAGDNFLSSFNVQPAGDGDAVIADEIDGFLFVHNMEVIPAAGEHSYDGISVIDSSVHLDLFNFVIGNFEDSSTTGTAIDIDGGAGVQLTARHNTRSFQIGGGLLRVRDTTEGSLVQFDESTSLGISPGEFGIDLQNNSGGAAFEFAGEVFLAGVVRGLHAVNSGRVETPLDAGHRGRFAEAFGDAAVRMVNIDTGEDGLHLDAVLAVDGNHGVHLENVGGAGVFIGSTEIEATTDVALQVLDSPNTEFDFGTTIVVGSEFDIDTIVGTGVAGSSGDNGPAEAAQVDTPSKVAVDRKGNLFIADRGAHTVRRVDALTGVITTIAGTGTAGFSGDGAAAVDAQLNEPQAVLVDEDGNILIADAGNHRIRYIDIEAGTITTVAGTGTAALLGDGGAATAAALNGPADLTFDNDGNLLIADRLNHVIRRIDADTGVISTLVGTGAPGAGDQDETPTQFELNLPTAIVFGSNDELAIADTGNHRVVGVDFAANTAFNMLGTGVAGNNGNETENPASFQLDGPSGLALHPRGVILINDANNHRVVAFTPTLDAGFAEVVAGTGVAGFSGDEGLAPLAELNQPSHVAAGNRGEIFIADAGNRRIRVIEFGYTSGDGILLDHNPDTTIAFDSLEVRSTGFGLLADDNGSVVIGDSHAFAGRNAIIDAQDGPALDIELTGIDNGLGEGVTFRNVSSFDSPTNGIILRNLSGDLTIESGLILGANADPGELNRGGRY